MTRRRALSGLVFVALAALSVGPALALSCRPFGPVAAFEKAQAATETYGVVLGTLSFDRGKAPESYAADARPVSLPGRVSGRVLGRGGFDRRVTVEVMLDFGCRGGWCGQIGPGESHLLFLREEAGVYHVDLDPSSPMGFPDPTPAEISAVETCMGGRCPR